VPEPSVVEPFRKVTVPDGVPAAEVTVAVRITLLPETMFEAETESAVELVAGLIVIETAVETEGLKFVVAA